MTKRKPKSEHKKDGRPTDYRKEYNDMACVACVEGGFTDKKLGKLFKVSEQTINAWKNKHPKFLESIKKGKDEFNVMLAENSLLKRIKGFSYTEVTKEPSIFKDAAGKLVGTELKITKKVTKKIIPDPTSIIFFLKNRNRERWPDKQRLEHSVDKDTISHAQKLADARGRKQKNE